MPFVAKWMDLEIIIVIQRDRDRERQISYISCMWSLKKLYKIYYLQNRNKLLDIENKFMVTKGEWGEE